ncbi:MAG TPA: multidrug effflux MFS transporter [Ferrovibrio sp.]|jgi:DHA1 family bicyclomycin/chloramphenicol resistance-like MFS transporter|uniref:multidrug effflux MFS transporter n=1 Tax=Ferrovibrio sp. TaxID=1917215 RepID=UPI002B4AB1C3|nr:multidrug effflux MFS transporter [Ferrovibrio sp.]HLT78464.1 multidrug effflux MFS transporter [Ferrovibrio sp.]
MWIVGSSFLPLGNVLSPSLPKTAPTGLVLLLSVLFANGILAATMYLPSLPAMGRDFAVPADTLPLTLTVYFATFAAGQLVYGPLSDRYGRRPLLLGGLVVMVLGSAACALAGSLTALLWARAIQGLGAASAMAVGRAIVNDAYDRQKAARATATISASLALAPIIAPLLGGLIEQYLGWRWNFWISGGITAAVLLILMRRLPETHRPSGDAGPLLRGIARAYGFLLTSRAFLTFGLLNLAIFAGLHGFNAGAPAVLIDTFGLSPVLFGILAALGAAGFFIGALLSSWLVGRLGMTRLIDAGVVCMLAGAAGLALWVELLEPSVSAIIGARLLWAIGMGLALPNTVVAAVGVNPATLGAGAALSGFLQTVGGGFGSAANSLFPAGDPLSLGLAFGGTAVFGGLVWLLNRGAAARVTNEKG